MEEQFKKSMSFLSATLAARAQQNLDALRNGDLLPAVASPNHHQRERRVDRGEFAFTQVHAHLILAFGS